MVIAERKKVLKRWIKINSFNDVTISCKLVDILNYKKVSVRELCLKTGIPREKINRLLYNEWRYFEKNEIERICSYLEIGIADLFETLNWLYAINIHKKDVNFLPENGLKRKLSTFWGVNFESLRF